MSESKDFAFLFKPGDYLRDTQCLSPEVQVAYDRIMCEMLRNICITQQRLNFFIKRLSSDQIDELMNVISITGDTYFIPWVRVSIEKRIAYSESRRKNRLPKKKTHEEHMLSHDKHMENENDYINDIENKKEGVQGKEKKKPGSNIPPMVEEVAEYCLSRGNGIDAKKFCDHYEARDWKPKGYTARMKNWQAAVRTWEPEGFKPVKKKVEEVVVVPPEERMTAEDGVEVHNLFKQLSATIKSI